MCVNSSGTRYAYSPPINSGVHTHTHMDPKSINISFSSDDEDSDLFLAWRQYRLMRRLAREHRYKLPNLWDWNGETLPQGEHHHNCLKYNITLKLLFNVLKPHDYMKKWIREKRKHPGSIVLIKHNNWLHAFHQDADLIHSEYDMDYDRGNVARVSIHGIYMDLLLETICEEFKIKII